MTLSLIAETLVKHKNTQTQRSTGISAPLH